MPDILYICDRQKCELCAPECKHTTDVNHAVNFTKVETCVVGTYFFEQEKETKND